jgi:hypothetical protein
LWDSTINTGANNTWVVQGKEVTQYSQVWWSIFGGIFPFPNTKSNNSVIDSVDRIEVKEPKWKFGAHFHFPIFPSVRHVSILSYWIMLDDYGPEIISDELMATMKVDLSQNASSVPRRLA